jgi:putative aldouronate transport system substrate-binding protein
MKRLLSYLLCLVLMFGFALNARADVTPNGEFPVVNEPITLKVFAPAIPSIVDLNTNKFTLWYEQRTGVHIEWITAPQSNSEEVLNLMLAGGDLPDIILGMDVRPEIEELYGPTEKMLVPLDDLIDQYAPNFKAIVEARPEILNFITATDGHIYGLPSIQDCYHCTYSQKMWINQDWMDKLGLKTPETIDDFYNVLVAFRDQDPNGNGQKDEIPLAGCKETEGWFQSVTGFILNAFVYDSGVYNQIKDYETKDGKVDTSINKDGYREGLRFLNKLYAEGLIYPDSFTMTGDSMKALALNETELVGAAPGGHLAMFLDVVTNPERYRHYTALAPLAGPDGTRQASYFPYFPIAQGEFYITSANKYPEASMRWADDFYNYTTGMARSWGEEGVAWRAAEPTEMGLDGKTPALFKTLVPFDEQAQNNNWSWLGIEYVDNKLWNGINVTTPDTDLYSAEGFEKLLWVETENKYEPYKPTEATELIKLRLDSDANDELAMLQVQLKNYIEASRVDFILGNLSLDNDWETYLSTLNDLGLPRYLELKQIALDKLNSAVK